MYTPENDSDLMPCRETMLEEENVRLRLENERLRAELSAANGRGRDHRALPRRRFLSLLGLGAAVAGVELVTPEPVRRFWQVGRGAPVGHRSPMAFVDVYGYPRETRDPRFDMLTERDAGGVGRDGWFFGAEPDGLEEWKARTFADGGRGEWPRDTPVTRQPEWVNKQEWPVLADGLMARDPVAQALVNERARLMTTA